MATRPDLTHFWLFASAIALFTQWSYAMPLLGSTPTTTDPEESAGMFEGDMILTPTQADLLANPIKGRNGLLDELKRWPDWLVYYKIVGNFDPVHRAAIVQGIDTIQSRTCLRFREADDTQKNYVAIGSQAGGCYTAVGYQGNGAQTMNLQVYPIGEGCFRPGTVLHELMHALGFYHEQSSAIRDDYIDVVYDNIVPGKEHNFKKYKESEVTDFGVGYDYDSCLHYRPGAFSVNGGPTIVPLDPQAKIGQRNGLSSKDIAKINVMYKCVVPI